MYTKIRIISRSVPGFVTDSYCRVWRHALTASLLYDGPLEGGCLFSPYPVPRFTVHRLPRAENGVDNSLTNLPAWGAVGAKSILI